MLQVKGVLDQEEVLFAKNKGYLYGTHVVVGLPECLAEASKEPHAVAVMQHTLAVAVDEVDACFLVSSAWILGICHTPLRVGPGLAPWSTPAVDQGGQLHCTSQIDITLQEAIDPQQDTSRPLAEQKCSSATCQAEPPNTSVFHALSDTHGTQAIAMCCHLFVHQHGQAFLAADCKEPLCIQAASDISKSHRCS